MKEYSSRFNKRLFWEITILIVGAILLLAELILLGIFLVGQFASRGHEADSGTTSTAGQIIVPDVSPARLNEYSVEDFDYDGQYLACLSAPYERGVDVSHYQGEIDWQQVKDAGFTFAIIRVGGRGYGQEGKLYEDASAQRNYEGAKAVGIKVGAYFFSQAITEIEAREEARYALELTEGWELDLPLVYDWEHINEDARTWDMEESDKIRFTTAFCETLARAGIQPMVYVAPWASTEYMLAVEKYPVWLVLYSDQMTFKYHFDYWQYSCTGEVPGIEGDVDINLYIPSAE